MKSYITISESSLDLARAASNKTLFDVDKNSAPLNKKTSEVFHSVVGKLLYIATRARLEVLLTVGSLCTHVSKSTVEVSMNLQRLLQ
jgi:hypothetical protein